MQPAMLPCKTWQSSSGQGKAGSEQAFTLIELLVVIAIIAIQNCSSVRLDRQR